MKITKSQLKRIIKEELSAVLAEEEATNRDKIKPCDLPELELLCKRGSYSGEPAGQYHAKVGARVVLLRDNPELKQLYAGGEERSLPKPTQTVDPDATYPVALQDGTTISIRRSQVLHLYAPRYLVVATK